MHSVLVHSLPLPPNLPTILISRRGIRTLMPSVVPFPHLGRVVIGLGMDLMRFLGVSLRSRTALAAETLFLSAIDGRTTRHPAYNLSQRCRKCVEELFGWPKTVGQLRKLHHRGTVLVNWGFLVRTTAYNLIRMQKLLAATA